MVKSTGGLGRGVRRSVVVVPRRPRGVRSVLVLRAILFYLAVQSVAPQERVVFFLFHALGLQLLVACGHVPRRRFAFIFRLCAFECDNFAWHDNLLFTSWFSQPFSSLPFSWPWLAPHHSEQMCWVRKNLRLR